METSKILYQTKNVRFYIDDSVPCLVNEWQGFIPSNTFREAILKLLEVTEELLNSYQQLKLLADTRTLGALKQADINWIENEINPQYIVLGITHEAFVVSQNAFGQASLKKYIKQTTQQGALTVCIFDDIETAKTWLRDC